jgi:uroporphyrinogen decarboxylase
MPTLLEQTCIKPNPDFEQFRRMLLRDGVPDYVPFYELFVDFASMEAVSGLKFTDQAQAVEFYYRAGYDYMPTFPTVPLLVGDLIDRSKSYPITNWKEFDAYPWPDASEITFETFDSVSDQLPKGMKMTGQTGGVLECAEYLMGYEQLCYTLMDDTKLAEALFDQIDRIYTAIYKGMAAKRNVGVLVISDDMGFKTQTLIGAEETRKYVLSIHKKLAEIAHSAGLPCILHSCGNLSEIMDDIINDVKIDAKHSYEEAILPVEEAKLLYGDRIAILGGFDLDRLCNSTEEEVREYTRSLVTDLGKDGGYALGTGNSVPAYVPPQNYVAMLEAGWVANGRA